jgi:hypothetical protein
MSIALAPAVMHLKAGGAGARQQQWQQLRFTNMLYQVSPPRILSKGGSVLMRALK